MRKKRWEPRRLDDLRIDMKFHDRRARCRGVRTVEIRSLHGDWAQCRAWYYGRKALARSTEIAKVRLLSSEFAYQGY